MSNIYYSPIHLDSAQWLRNILLFLDNNFIQQIYFKHVLLTFEYNILKSFLKTKDIEP